MSSIDEFRRRGGDLDGRAPTGDDASSLWRDHRSTAPLVSPLNRRGFEVVVVGTGLAGGGVAAALGELGYHVNAFTFHDAPRRAHSVAAQGGINAARARKVDNDGLQRFVRDTVKGGDYRGREADCYRLAEESARVIDHLNAIGAPFAREYGGSMRTRSFGGVQVSRTYYTRGQTGQQLQVAASQALLRQVARGTVTLHTRHEMLDLVVVDGHARGVVTRDLVTGEVSATMGHAVVLCTGGYGNVYFQSTLAKNSNPTAAWRAHRRGALFASPSFMQFHPTALPVNSPWQSKTTLMSESLRNDGRVWVPTRPGDDRPAGDIPDTERDYDLERRYPSFGNLAKSVIASLASRERIDAGHGVGPLRNSVYLDFRDALDRLGRDVIASRYGNLFDLYRDATGEDPWMVPMRIAPGAHFAMGGLWTDYDLQASIPGLFVGGEASSNYHGANRLGANSLLSASVDGWFTLPVTVPAYLAGHLGEPLPDPSDPAVTTTVDDVRAGVERLCAIDGTRPASLFHRELGELMYRHCGVTRSAQGLRDGIEAVRALRDEFWSDLRVVGTPREFNQDLERAGRVGDYFELAELMLVDALDRDESCGAHFRVEHQTEAGEALRNDEDWCFVSAWEHGRDGVPIRHREPLSFQHVPMQTRSYA